VVDTPISGATTVANLLPTDLFPLARSGSSVAYNATAAQIGASFQASGTATGIAAAGGGQGGATALTAGVNIVTSGSGGVILVAGGPVGSQQTVVNRSGANITVYPGTGAAIEALSTNAGIVLPNGASSTFVYAATNQWYST